MLIDDVAALTGQWRRNVAADPHELPLATPAFFDGLERRLDDCVRYAFDADAIQLVNALSFGDFNKFASLADLIRPPHPLMWIEYPEEGRKRWYDMNGRPTGGAWPSRSGILIRATEDGFDIENFFDYERQVRPNSSRGEFYRTANPDRCAITARFVAPDITADAAAAWASRTNCASWELYPIEALAQHMGGDVAAVRAALIQDISTEIVMAAAACLTLTLPGMFEKAPADLARLNRTRTRAGKPALRDYTRVAIARAFRPQAELLFDYHTHSSPRRPHIVRGHFKRLARGLTWWNSHIRNRGPDGDPEAPIRTRRVSP